MTDTTRHLSEGTLEQLAEEMLSGSELAVATTHLRGCGRCAAELEGYRALYAALGELPRFAPAAGFGEAVMARVRVGPAPSPLWSAVQRWAPGSRRGWAMLTTAVAAPVVAMVAALAWLVSHPLVSASSLLGLAWGGAAGAVQSGASAAVRWGMQSGVWGLGQTALQAVGGLPVGTLAAIVTVLAIAIPLSAWSLIRLVRTPMGNVHYAN